MVKIEPTTLAHVRYVAAHMRETDIKEIGACGELPMSSLTKGYESSVICNSLTIDGVPCAIFGVAEMTKDIGIPWLLGTDGVKSIRREFIAGCREVVGEMLELYPVLTNCVDERNLTSIRWLKWLGFKILPSVPFGKNGELFHPFEMRLNNVPD